MKFKVGDKVRVKTMAELAAKYGKPYQGVCGATVTIPSGFNFTSAMEPYGGTFQTIINTFSKNGYYLSGVNGGYVFTDEMLDGIVGHKKRKTI